MCIRDSPVFVADGDGEGIRPREDAQVPALRARPLPRRTRGRGGRRAAAVPGGEPAVHLSLIHI